MSAGRCWPRSGANAPASPDGAGSDLPVRRRLALDSRPQGADVAQLVEHFTRNEALPRKRPRTVVVELEAIREELRAPSEADLADWEGIRGELRRLVGESTFEIWLATVELAATDPGGRLLLNVPVAVRGWVGERFAIALDRAGQAAGRQLQIADDRTTQLLDALATHSNAAAALDVGALPLLPHPVPHKEAV